MTDIRSRTIAGLRAGDTFTLTALNGNRRAIAEAIFTNQAGEIVLEANLYGVLPNTDQRKVLQTLMAPGDRL